MPIHDQSYRHYEGRREPPGRTWTVIAVTGIRSLIVRRAFLALLLLAWGPFVVRAVQFYLATNFPQVPMLAPTAETFREFLDQQGFFVFCVAIYVGAGLIANDRRANALQIYLSKPLTRIEYVAGKLAILVAFLLLVTWVPGVMLMLTQMLLSGSLTFIRSHFFLFPAITLFAFVEVLVAGFAMLALSSLSNSSRYVGILYAAVVLFSDAISAILRAVTGSTATAWISFPANLAQLGDVIFRLQPRHAMPWPVSLIVLVAIIAGAIVVLERRVRGVEVVA